jgi:hypothetical protein
MRALMVSIALALTLTACGGDSGTTAPTNASLAGTWNLQTVNGAPLPFVFFQAGTDKEEITGDQFTFTSSGSFSQITTLRHTVNGQVSTETDTDAGTYSLNGTAIVVTFNSDGSSSTGSVSSNTITVTDQGLVAVYKKQ